MKYITTKKAEKEGHKPLMCRKCHWIGCSSELTGGQKIHESHQALIERHGTHMPAFCPTCHQPAKTMDIVWHLNDNSEYEYRVRWKYRDYYLDKDYNMVSLEEAELIGTDELTYVRTRAKSQICKTAYSVSVRLRKLSPRPWDWDEGAEDSKTDPLGTDPDAQNNYDFWSEVKGQYSDLEYIKIDLRPIDPWATIASPSVDFFNTPMENPY
jgi:hypothetical protein